jgi:hypothetical protein
MMLGLKGTQQTNKDTEAAWVTCFNLGNICRGFHTFTSTVLYVYQKMKMKPQYLLPTFCGPFPSTMWYVGS